MQAPLKYNLKLFPSPADPRDHIIKAAQPVKAKGSVDLSQHCTSVKDQGVIGSCTAFATVGAMEFLHKRFGGSQVDDLFSERFTYYATRVNVLGWVPEDSGAYVRDAIKSLVKFGTCLENRFAYNNDFRMPPPSTAYSDALKYQALSYAKFEDGTSPTNRAVLIETLKANLDAGLPITGGFICYSNIWNAVNGVIPAKNGQVIGGHAILIVGYDDSKRLFKFKNSWGVGWGDKGYGYLPYDYYLLGDMFDLWAIQRAETDGINKSVGLEVSNPATQKNKDKESVLAILQEIASKIDLVLDPASSMATMNQIQTKYRTDLALSGLVNNMKNSLLSVASRAAKTSRATRR